VSGGVFACRSTPGAAIRLESSFPAFAWEPEKRFIGNAKSFFFFDISSNYQCLSF